MQYVPGGPIGWPKFLFNSCIDKLTSAPIGICKIGIIAPRPLASIQQSASTQPKVFGAIIEHILGLV